MRNRTQMTRLDIEGIRRSGIRTVHRLRNPELTRTQAVVTGTVSGVVIGVVMALVLQKPIRFGVTVGAGLGAGYGLLRSL